MKRGRLAEGIRLFPGSPALGSTLDNDLKQEPQMASEKKSRAQLKRDRQELRDLGVELVALSAEQLRAIPLSERTVEAVLAAQGMTRIALKRQIGHIPALLVEENLVAVRAALAGELQPHADEVEALHKAENWRDRLLASNDSLTEFIDRYPGSDPTRIRQLVRNAKKERKLEKPPKSARLLFRYVRELLSEVLEPES